MKERIVSLISVSDIGGMQVLMPDSFIAEYPDWRQRLLAGWSFYVDAQGQALSAAEALRRLEGLAATAQPACQSQSRGLMAA